MKMSKGEKVFNVFNITCQVIFVLVMIVPMIYILKKSFDAGSQSDLNLSLIPVEFSTIYYKIVFSNKGIYRPFINSVFITVIGTTLAVFLQSMGAYTLTKRRLPGLKIFIYMMVVPMMFSGGLIPYYLLIKTLGMMDKFIVLILPACISGWNIFLIRNYYWSIPDSLNESAKMDGASEFTVFIRIILPLSKPVLSAISLFTAVSYWNTFFDALMFMRTPTKYTFPVVLQEMILQKQDSQSELQKMAGGSEALLKNLNTEGITSAIIVVSIVPILFIYPYLQKYFTKGIMVGAIKG